LIIFREVFVSGLREYLGDASGKLQVTKLAKWKTSVQMLAIVLLLVTGVFGHLLLARTVGMDPAQVADILEQGGSDPLGLRWFDGAARLFWWSGVALLWVAAALTLVTGIEYFRKALPYLKDTP